MKPISINLASNLASDAPGNVTMQIASTVTLSGVDSTTHLELIAQLEIWLGVLETPVGDQQLSAFFAKVLALIRRH